MTSKTNGDLFVPYKVRARDIIDIAVVERADGLPDDGAKDQESSYKRMEVPIASRTSTDKKQISCWSWRRLSVTALKILYIVALSTFAGGTCMGLLFPPDPYFQIACLGLFVWSFFIGLLILADQQTEEVVLKV